MKPRFYKGFFVEPDSDVRSMNFIHVDIWNELFETIVVIGFGDSPNIIQSIKMSLPEASIVKASFFGHLRILAIIFRE